MFQKQQQFLEHLVKTAKRIWRLLNAPIIVALAPVLLPIMLAPQPINSDGVSTPQVAQTCTASAGVSVSA